MTLHAAHNAHDGEWEKLKMINGCDGVILTRKIKIIVEILLIDY